MQSSVPETSSPKAQARPSRGGEGGTGRRVGAEATVIIVNVESGTVLSLGVDPTAWWETGCESRRTDAMSESVSACGLSCTAASTASRGRVTRNAARRSIASNSAVVGTC